MSANQSPAEPREQRRLLLRYRRGPNGEMVHTLPYSGGRDDSALLAAVPLAFDTDLSPLPPAKRSELLSFEKAYGEFYELWRGSGYLTKTISRAIDLVQRDLENLRSAIQSELVPDCRADELPGMQPPGA